MAQVELILPKMGESITEATILKWLKNVGDTVEADENVVEIATDKVDSEVPSPVAGVITKLLVNEDDVVEVNKAIAIISTDGEAPVSSNGSATGAQTQAPVSIPEPISEQETIPVSEEIIETAATAITETLESTQKVLSAPITGRFYSPLVLNIARQERIGMNELDRIPGTGNEGRVTKKDILSYLQNKDSKEPAIESPKVESEPIVPTPPPAEINVKPVAPAPEIIKPEASPAPVAEPVKKPEPAPAPKANIGTVVSSDASSEIVEMDRMRQLIADHMVRSKATSAHVTSFVEADVTNLVRWRNKIKDEFQKREGEKLTFTPIFIEVIAKLLKEFPYINSSVDGKNIIVKKNINIGLAAALPSGNLIVPVIKNADQKNLIGLAKNVNDLVNRARKGKLKPEEIDGGTFTLSNVGTFGNLAGTPIINQPQVAIVATGSIIKKPAVLETPDGDVIAIRHMMMISMSYDHRIVDGAMGGSFIRRLADEFESWDVNRAL